MPACTGHTVRTYFTATETNKLNVLIAFYCVPEHGNRIISLSFNEQPNFLWCFDCFGMHNRPNIGKIPTTYKRTASNKYESWQNFFWQTFLTTLFFVTKSTLNCHHLPLFAHTFPNTVHPSFVTVLVVRVNHVLPFHWNQRMAANRWRTLIIKNAPNVTWLSLIIELGSHTRLIA